MTPWILVTPATRGLGLEFARRLLRTTDLPVVATARGSTDEARESILKQREKGDYPETDSEGDESRLTVLKLDVTNEQTIADAASHCDSLFPTKPKDSSPTPSHLHLALAIPGVLHPEKSPAQLDLQDIQHTFDINVIGPLLLLKHFAPFLPRKNAPSLPLPDSAGAVPKTHATWANMSARVGSITENRTGGWYSYRASKAAVSQVTKSFDNFLQMQSAESACALAMHPGTVKTGLSKEFWNSVREGKLFSPEFSVARLMETINSVGVKGRGKVWDYNQKEIAP